MHSHTGEGAGNKGYSDAGLMGRLTTWRSSYRERRAPSAKDESKCQCRSSRNVAFDSVVFFVFLTSTIVGLFTMKGKTSLAFIEQEEIQGAIALSARDGPSMV